jgi:murein DD-endopeptidase MepM/ murein hydrolase activator NlpD
VQKNESIFSALKKKFRLIVQDDQSFEEIMSSSFSRLQLITRLLSLCLLVALLAVSIVAFTPLREYIPGYSPPHLSKDLVSLSVKTDSLIRVVDLQNQKTAQLNGILSGELDADSVLIDTVAKIVINTDALIASKQDSLYREVVERKDRFNILNEAKKEAGDLKNVVFYTPIKGFVSDAFDLSTKHYGVDVVAPKNEAVKSCLSGTVIFSDWTTETGYAIAIQHEKELISFYKHNSVLLKEVGEVVLAGDVIAIIGNSGKLSSGPHLHFELWHKGLAINPEQHILF